MEESDVKRDMRKIDRRDFLKLMGAVGLTAVAPWPLSVPIYPLTRPEEMRAYGYRWGSCPIAEETARKLVGLPTHSKIDTGWREEIVRLIAKVYR